MLISISCGPATASITVTPTYLQTLTDVTLTFVFTRFRIWALQATLTFIAHP